MLFRLLKHPPALLAILIVVLTCLTALLAPVIAPDRTPHANTMIVELGAREPGFRCKLLMVPKKVIPEMPSLLTRWIKGTPSGHNPVPVNAYYFQGDSLTVRHYIDDGLEDTLTYALTTLLPFSMKDAAPPEARQWITDKLIKTQTFYLGTDKYGRDIFSRLLLGTRVSIAVGLVAVILSLSIGVLLGALAGYFGGWVDAIVMWLINMLWAIPTLLLVFAITLTVGKGFWEIFIAIGLTMWVGAARLIRGQVLVLREMEYITAAKASGLSDLRIIFRHILPNVAGPVMVIAAANFATAILIEAGLSFLGIGVQPPQPSWGLMIKEHYNFLLTNRAMLAIIPGIAIMLLVFAFNILGNALRDILDVRQD